MGYMPSSARAGITEKVMIMMQLRSLGNDICVLKLRVGGRLLNPTLNHNLNRFAA